MNSFDVTVIGGSLSGSYLALLLSQSGYRVLLVEKEHLPRRKACGEGMAEVAKRYLQKIGIWNALPADSYSPYYGYDLYLETAQGSRAISLRKPQSTRPEGYRVSRSILDEKVFKRTLFTPTIERKEACARSLQFENGEWVVDCGGETATSKYVVTAAGATALPLLKRSLQVSEKVRGKDNRFGVVYWLSGKWTNGTPDTVIARSNGRCQTLLTAINDNLLNVSLLINKSDSSFTEKEKSELFEQSLAFASSHGFELDTVLEQRGAARIESRKILTKHSHLYLIGDSAEVFDPIGGLGMVHAFESAELAAESLHLALSGTVSPYLAASAYRWRRNFFAMRVRFLTSLSYTLNVDMPPLLVSLIQFAPGLSAKLFSFLRKKLLRSRRSKKMYLLPERSECRESL